jgi:hypothetical protein
MENCTLQYYYYVPCPSYSWFWGFFDWTCGDIIGQVFTAGDVSMGMNEPCDPTDCFTVVGARVLDFAGYGTVYPGLFTVQFNIFCADEFSMPVGPSLWESNPYETHSGWNEIVVSPGVLVSECATDFAFWPSYPRFLLTATHIGSECTYPQWALDNVSGAIIEGCAMHDLGCLPALYPRPYTSHYDIIHSGYYGVDFAYNPPLYFLDGADTSEDGSIFGFLELAWKVMLECHGPATEPSTWSGVKSMYR